MTENELKTLLKTVTPPNKAARAAAHAHWAALAKPLGGLACIGSGTLLGVLILVLPSFKNWINATMGGPAVPATIISLVFGIVVSLMFPVDTTPDDVRLKHVMDDRRGTVVEKVAAAEAAAEEEEDL